ncbi:MAG: hypothetical protein AB1721_03200 [Patescibacteria group bacterium]
MKLTKQERAALMGMVLGDGYLQKVGKRNARLRLEHSFKQRDYLEWKTELLPKLFQGKPKMLKRVHPITHKTYSYVRHQSNSSPDLGKLRQIFYPEGKKHLPENLEHWLISALTLAIWYLDDGYYYPRDNCSYLYLGRVSHQEAIIVQRAILKKFGLTVKVLDKKQKGFVLYFSTKETESLVKLIKQFIMPQMAYKIPS